MIVVLAGLALMNRFAGDILPDVPRIPPGGLREKIPWAHTVLLLLAISPFAILLSILMFLILAVESAANIVAYFSRKLRKKDSII